MTTTRRKRRIAADECHSWARNLRLKNPYAKLVLGMLTLYVNGDGICFVGIETLAEDTELSTDTVRKRLAWLEQVGAVARFPQWIDGNGRRNSDGRGKRTSDEIRLLMDADPDVIEARALGDEDAGNEPESAPAVADDAVISPRSQQGLNPPENSAGPGLALCQPSDSGKGLISEPEPEPKEDSPPTPQAGGDDSEIDQSSEATQPTEVEGWESFKAAFEADSAPILRVSLAKGLFAALKPEERKLATNAARGLIAQRKGEKKPGMKPAAQTFLREIEAWPGYAKLAPPEATPPTFIIEHSPEDLALRVLDRILNRASQQMKFDLAQGVNGWWRTVPVPSDLLGLAIFADKPIEQWRPVEKDSKPLFAWLDRIVKWTGHRPELQRIFTGGEHPFTYNNQTTMIKNYVMGLRVPHPFPPRKDGTISSSTDPPKESSAA